MYSLSIFSNIMWAPIVYYQCPLKEQSENRRELAHVQKAHATASNVVCYFRNAPTSFSWLFLSPRWKDNRDKSRETCWLQHDQHCTHISPNLRFVYFYFFKSIVRCCQGHTGKKIQEKHYAYGHYIEHFFFCVKKLWCNKPVWQSTRAQQFGMMQSWLCNSAPHWGCVTLNQI